MHNHYNRILTPEPWPVGAMKFIILEKALFLFITMYLVYGQRRGFQKFMYFLYVLILAPPLHQNLWPWVREFQNFRRGILLLITMYLIYWLGKWDKIFFKNQSIFTICH